MRDVVVGIRVVERVRRGNRRPFRTVEIRLLRTGHVLANKFPVGVKVIDSAWRSGRNKRIFYSVF